MPQWNITPVFKKSVQESTEYRNADGISVTREAWWRWGSWCCECDTAPDVDVKNPSGFRVFDSQYNWSLNDMSDEVSEDWHFPDSMCEEHRDQIMEAYGEDGDDALDELGWESYDTVVTLHGTLELSQEPD